MSSDTALRRRALRARLLAQKTRDYQARNAVLINAQDLEKQAFRLGQRRRKRIKGAN